MEETSDDPIALLYGLRYPDPKLIDKHYVSTLASVTTELKIPEQDLEQFSVDDSGLEALQVEYTRLFVNAVPRVIAPPYASVYVDGDKGLQGKTTEKTRIFYRECGFDLADETEPADHLALELEFLSHLAAESRFEDEELFLKTLFRPWFRHFYKYIIPEVQHPFYRALIHLTATITKEEQ